MQIFCRLPLALLLLVVVALPARAVEVERVVSPGGIEAWLVEDHSNPIISLDLAFRGGAALDPRGKEGLAGFVAATIDEGAGPYDSQAFQRRLEELAVRLSFDAGQDSVTGSLRTLTENRAAAFELLRLALTAPRFDPEPVERIRNQIVTGLVRDADDPGYIAATALRRLLFPDHPYGRPSEGTPESLARITAEDLRRFVAERFGRDRLIVGVAGDITPDELGRLLDATFLDLPASAPIDLPSDIEPRATGDLVVVERDIPQTVVAFGQGGLRRDDPDFYAAHLVNHILGGGSFSSRLYQDVREQRGLAYSVYTYLLPLDHAGLLLGGVATQNARVAESFALIRDNWRRMAEDGPTAEELEAAKLYQTGSFPLRLSSSGAIAGMLVGMQLEDLGIDYLERRNDYIEAVTLEDARRVARELLAPADLTAVMVGRPAGVTPTREAPDPGT